MKLAFKFILSIYLLLWLSACQSEDPATEPTVENKEEVFDENGLKFLALGDSYTAGHGVPSSQSWPYQLAEDMTMYFDTPFAKPEYIAVTGWTSTLLKHGIAEIKPEPHFDLVSLLIGVNDQIKGSSPTNYQQDFETLLQKAIELAQGDHKRVIVLSLPDYGYTPYGQSNQPAISQAIDHFNSINQEITNRYQVSYINITGISRQSQDNPDLLVADGLHPSGLQYSRWVEQIVSNPDFRSHMGY